MVFHSELIYKITFSKLFSDLRSFSRTLLKMMNHQKHWKEVHMENYIHKSFCTPHQKVWCHNSSQQLQEFLSFRISDFYILDFTFSAQVKAVVSGFPQDSVLGLAFFSTFGSDVVIWIERTSSRLLTTPSCVVWLTSCWKGMTSRGTFARLRSGPLQTSWYLTWLSAKSCTLVRKILSTSTSGEEDGSRLALGRKTCACL